MSCASGHKKKELQRQKFNGSESASHGSRLEIEGKKGRERQIEWKNGGREREGGEGEGEG